MHSPKDERTNVCVWGWGGGGGGGWGGGGGGAVKSRGLTV